MSYFESKVAIKRLSITTKRILIQNSIDLGFDDTDIIESLCSNRYQKMTISRMIGEIRCANSKQR